MEEYNQANFEQYSPKTAALGNWCMVSAKTINSLFACFTFLLRPFLILKDWLTGRLKHGCILCPLLVIFPHILFSKSVAGNFNNQLGNLIFFLEIHLILQDTECPSL